MLIAAAETRADESLKTAPWFHSLADALREPVAVRKLDLSDQGLAEFPADILRLPKLEMLLLNYNQLSALPADLGRLARLSELEVNNNAFTAFPREILELAALNELELSGNRSPALPADVARLARLTELEMRENELTALPPEIGRLLHLEELKVDQNCIEALPAEVFGLPVLIELTVAGNRLGALPENTGDARAPRTRRLAQPPRAISSVRACPASAAASATTLSKIASPLRWSARTRTRPSAITRPTKSFSPPTPWPASNSAGPPQSRARASSIPSSRPAAFPTTTTPTP